MLAVCHVCPNNWRLLLLNFIDLRVCVLMNYWKTQRSRISAKSRFGEKLSYIAKYRNGVQVFLSDGTFEIDSNTVERSIRPIALNRKNAFFAG